MSVTDHTLSSYMIMKMMERGENVPVDLIRITKICRRCEGAAGTRMRWDDPHLINVFAGTIHGYGDWADRTACGRDCTGPKWWHRF